MPILGPPGGATSRTDDLSARGPQPGVAGAPSASARRRTLFALFFASGACGLLYQIVWLRLAFASFGVVTPVLSVVVSVFMLGLALGSWLAGRFIERGGGTAGATAIVLYAAAELVIGMSAFAVPMLFRLGEGLLLPLGGHDSLGYLAASALVLGACLLPPCVAMGTTIPLMLAFVRQVGSGDRRAFSFLYTANVVGAMAGTALTAVVLIEWLGLRGTLVAAASLNALLALGALTLGWSHRRALRAAAPPPAADAASAPRTVDAPRPRGALGILFLTGFCSMGFEVIWTRAFTAVLGTLVYSFALLLFTYLVATWLGAALYRAHAARGRAWGVPGLLAGLACTALLPVVLNDPRLLPGRPDLVVPSVFPFCALLGYLTPMLVDLDARGAPARAGRAYAVNVLGCILGPLVASYVLLPTVGARLGIVVLAAPFLALLLVSWRALGARPGRRALAAGGAGALTACALFVNVSYEEGAPWPGALVLRDHSGTVIAHGEGMDRRLLVNGMGMTLMTPITKLMAHLPLAVHGEADALLAVCFGMGTTYRASLAWDVDTTAVELCGPVPEAFPYYFDDAEALLAHPKGRVVIDDGRRFLRRASRQWDVITIDPPPPIETAGSSLLYSREFYALVRERLRPGGLLQHWCPSPDPRVVAAVTRSLVESFPHVRAWRSFEGWGFHYTASDRPIGIPSAEQLVARMPPAALADLVEWNEGALADPRTFLETVLAGEVDVAELLRADPDAVITDDRPYNEYLILRTLSGSAATR